MVQLCRYHYDALDRLVGRTPLAEAMTRHFYRGDTLATQTQGADQRSFLVHDGQLLAQQTVAGKLGRTALAAGDLQHSVLHTTTPTQKTAIAYSPYGHRQPVANPPGLPGFNAQQPDPITGHYPLGNGYRAYSPTLMRFNSPDSLSPFGKGGLNAYAYCAGDPVNRQDPSGHEIETAQILSFLALGLGLFTAVLGGLKAVPAMKAVMRGEATLAEQLTGNSAVALLVASPLMIAGGIVRVVDPDTDAANILLGTAVGIGLLTVAPRIWAHYLSGRPPLAPVRPVSYNRRGSNDGSVTIPLADRASIRNSGIHRST